MTAMPEMPNPKYRLTLTILGNTLEDIENSLRREANDFRLDSDGYTRDSWDYILSGFTDSKLECVNPGKTEENYRAEVETWIKALAEYRAAGGES